MEITYSPNYLSRNSSGTRFHQNFASWCKRLWYKDHLLA